MAAMACVPGRIRGTGSAGMPVRICLALIACLLGLASCSADEPDDPPGNGEEVALHLELVYGEDDLDAATRIEVETEVGDVLSRYVAGAFLGDYPRQDFVSSFEDFTPRAARSAATHIEVLTGTGFADASSVRASALDARLSLFAPPDGVLAATATVDFKFEVTQDSTTSTATLSGRLMLLREQGDWSVFGYDVELDDGGALDAAVS